MNSLGNIPRRERGIVLIASLLLLVLVTIMALAMFRGYGIEEKIAGNTREKQRALQAAESAQEYAEYWLASNSNAASGTTICSTLLPNADQPVICQNTLPTVMGSTQNIASGQWQVGSTAVGVQYLPHNMQIGTAAVGLDNYANPPKFYISYLGDSIDPAIPGKIFQIDAVGYGGNSTTAAVVESTYAVYVTSGPLGNP